MHAAPSPRLATLAARDGLPLRTAVWPVPAGSARGTVVVLQGRAEFIEKYGETAGDLRARGFAVHALDWRGQGGSGRMLDDTRKGHVVSYKDYLSDLDLFLEESVLPDAPGPSSCWPIRWAGTSCSATVPSTAAPRPISRQELRCPPPWWISR